ncbi:uncharacterized protein LOC126752005 isoform X1 [Bactrocera neohumeralis]|uniref:uncharacterized protein LOC126752005 isoform X1 n=1 Tax=Bactrocera neohumeralis TaxID=98809 RepID=UPI002164FE62|nr:uncharacterized protein LOC126752005 isoform X1 [Bactrocera neohumeralis]
MAAAKRILATINFIMIMKINFQLINGNTLYPTNIYESIKLKIPVIKTESKSYSESTANDLAPSWQTAAHNDLTVTKHLHKTDVLQHTANPIDGLLITCTEAFIRASLKVFQKKLKSATAAESVELFDVLLKIKNLSKPDEALLAKALYKTFEKINEVNADLTLTESEQTLMEALLEHFEQMLQQEQLGTSMPNVYEGLTIEHGIERNFDAVKRFWLEL